MVPLESEMRWIKPSWEPTATTELAGLMAREVSGPASKRVSISTLAVTYRKKRAA
jgi:hypothetical protein